MEALAPRDHHLIAAERPLERQGLADVAAEIGGAAVQGPVGVLAGEIAGVGTDGADVGETEAVDQLGAVAPGFPEQLAGIEEDHRQVRVDLRRPCAAAPPTSAPNEETMHHRAGEVAPQGFDQRLALKSGIGFECIECHGTSPRVRLLEPGFLVVAVALGSRRASSDTAGAWNRADRRATSAAMPSARRLQRKRSRHLEGIEADLAHELQLIGQHIAAGTQFAGKAESRAAGAPSNRRARR